MSNPVSKKHIVEYYRMVTNLQNVIALMNCDVDQLLLTMWKEFLKKYFSDNLQSVVPSKSLDSEEQKATYSMIFEKLKKISTELNIPIPKENTGDNKYERLKFDVLIPMVKILEPICTYAHAPVYEGARGMLTYWNHKMGGTAANVIVSGGILCGLSALPINVFHVEKDFLSETAVLSITLPLVAICLASLFVHANYIDSKLVKYAKKYDNVPWGLKFTDERTDAEKKENKLDINFIV